MSNIKLNSIIKYLNQLAQTQWFTVRRTYFHIPHRVINVSIWQGNPFIRFVFCILLFMQLPILCFICHNRFYYYVIYPYDNRKLQFGLPKQRVKSYSTFSCVIFITSEIIFFCLILYLFISRHLYKVHSLLVMLFSCGYFQTLLTPFYPLIFNTCLKYPLGECLINLHYTDIFHRDFSLKLYVDKFDAIMSMSFLCRFQNIEIIFMSC